MAQVIALLLGVLLAGPVLAQQPSFQEIEESLTCQCGCGLTVHSCNHLQCGSALPLRKEIREQLAKGLDKETILTYFADKYGEKILSSPTTEGFNLTAWVLPFAAVGMGGLFVMWTLLRWRSGRAETPATVPPAGTLAASKNSEYDAILQKELDRFDT